MVEEAPMQDESQSSPGQDEHVNPDGPPPPDYAPDGTDLTLIRWMLSLTPTERLNALQGAADSVVELQNAKRIG
jgi:hypothetical protein